MNIRNSDKAAARALVPGRTLQWVKQLLLVPAAFLNSSVFYVGRLALSCARGSLNASTLRLDPRRTVSWEFSAFSQNGEDGIIEQLLSLIAAPTRYFVEIGASDGLENNSSYLAFVKKYQGLMVEGDQRKSANSRRFLQSMNWGVRHLNMMVTPDRASELCEHVLYREPDLLSLDIDGMDYYVARAILGTGLRPKVLCVEYNSAFGPFQAVTVPYGEAFDYKTEHPSLLYYGVSLEAWKRLLGSSGYHFVTVDSSGVNAFFVDPSAVDMAPLADLQNIEFEENASQRLRSGQNWQGQFELIRHLNWHTVDADGNAVDEGS